MGGVLRLLEGRKDAPMDWLKEKWNTLTPTLKMSIAAVGAVIVIAVICSL